MIIPDCGQKFRIKYWFLKLNSCFNNSVNKAAIFDSKTFTVRILSVKEVHVLLRKKYKKMKDFK